MTTDVFRYEAWPDFSFDDPLFLELVGATVPYMQPAVWSIQPEWSDQQKIDSAVSLLKKLKEDVTTTPPFPEWFVFKHYKNEYLVGIQIGLVYSDGAEKTFFSSATLLRPDENGLRDYAKYFSTDGYRPIPNFLAQYGISKYTQALPEGHPRISILSEKCNIYHDSIAYMPHWITGEMTKMYIYDMMKMCNR